MPEGDTIHNAARRVGAALVGRSITAIETPHPRHRHDRWPERLAGRSVRSVDAHGKHLFVRFDGDLTLHSHLRMGGMWGVYRRGERWRRSPRRAWLVIRTDDHDVVQFDGPVLELMTDGRTRFDQRLNGLGPDLLRDDFDEDAFVRRLREDDQTRGIGEALLDQRNVAGIGNIWKSESCHLAGISPWRAVRERLGRRGQGDRPRGAAAHAAVRRAWRQNRDRGPVASSARSRESNLGVRASGPAVPSLRHARAVPRPGRRQPHRLLVPAVPELSDR